MENEIIATDLKLTVKKLELGVLTTNAITIRDKVKEMLVNYKAENYNEDSIEKAKDDKALLNSTSKLLNDERIKLEKEFMKPFDEFKDVVKETTDMIKDASSKIDIIVKEVESKAKEIRKETIENLFKSSVGELESIVTLEIIFDEKWLNKGSFNNDGEFKKQKELEDKLNTIRKDLEAIKALNSKHELALINQYLKNLDLGQVIVENNRLNELELKQVVVEDKKEEIKEEKILEMITNPVEVEQIDPIKTYILEITGTLSQQTKLKEFLDINKMTYKKLTAESVANNE